LGKLPSNLVSLAKQRQATVQEVLLKNRFADNTNSEGVHGPDLIPLHQHNELIGYILLDQISAKRHNGQPYRQLSQLVIFGKLPKDPPALDVMIEELLEAIAVHFQWTCGFMVDTRQAYAHDKRYNVTYFFDKRHWRNVSETGETYHKPFDPKRQDQRQTPHAGPSNS
jgi:hypothetical protein